MNTALLLIAVLSFTVVAWRDLKLAILIILAALPSYLIRFSVGPIPTTLLEGLILTILLIFLVKNFSVPNFPYPISPIQFPILLLFLASTISIFVAPDHLAALGVWRAYFVEPMLFFFVVRTTLIEPHDRERALQALGIGALAVSVFAIIQHIIGFGIPIPWDFERRVTSFFEYPNAVGLYVAPIVTIAVLCLCEELATLRFRSGQAPKSRARLLRSARKDKIFWLFVAVLGLVAIILAKTEAALVAIPAALIIVAFLKTKNRKVRGGLMLGTLLLSITTFQISDIKGKLLLNDYSGMVRRSQWSETVEMLKDRPLFGAGLSGYPSTLEPYHADTQYEIFQYPHNIFLNIWSELGLLGFVAFLWLAVVVLRHVLAPDSNNYPIPQLPNYILLAALLTMTIHGLVDVPYFKNDLALMTWSFLALPWKKNEQYT